MEIRYAGPNDVEPGEIEVVSAADAFKRGVELLGNRWIGIASKLEGGWLVQSPSWGCTTDAESIRQLYQTTHKAIWDRFNHSDDKTYHGDFYRFEPSLSWDEHDGLELFLNRNASSGKGERRWGFLSIEDDDDSPCTGILIRPPSHDAVLQVLDEMNFLITKRPASTT